MVDACPDGAPNASTSDAGEVLGPKGTCDPFLGKIDWSPKGWSCVSQALGPGSPLVKGWISPVAVYAFRVDRSLAAYEIVARTCQLGGKQLRPDHVAMDLVLQGRRRESSAKAAVHRRNVRGWDP